MDRISLVQNVGMSVAEREIFVADRPFFMAAAALEKFAGQAETLRRGLAALRLPLPDAEDKLDHVDDSLATVGAQIERALSLIGEEIDRRQEANPDHYFAPMSPANDETQTEDAA
jgi:hypothetical protein